MCVYLYKCIYIYIYLYIYNTCIHTIDPPGHHLIGFMAAGTLMHTYVRLQLDNWAQLCFLESKFVFPIFFNK